MLSLGFAWEVSFTAAAVLVVRAPDVISTTEVRDVVRVTERVDEDVDVGSCTESGRSEYALEALLPVVVSGSGVVVADRADVLASPVLVISPELPADEKVEETG